MSQAEPRRRMTGSDAMFLYFERKEMPLHIGSVAILDGPFDAEGEQVFADRLPEIPRYRQRAVFAPLNLTHPFWEYDPDFDIRNHIRRIALDPPGNEAQLAELAGRVFTPVMDRGKPLWDLTVVDGVEGGRSALICRVHHSMMDGVSGITLVNGLFDTTREPRRVEPQAYQAPPLPDSRQVLVEGLSAAWADVASRVIGSQISLLRLFEAYAGASSQSTLRGLRDTMPELLRPAERLPFNRPCSGVRGYCWTAVPFAEVRAIRAALGGTINDVVLAVVAGAISRYVAAHREPVKNRFARLLVPVNARPADEANAAGNQISMLPLSVPLGIDDPVERMKAITWRANAMKNARIADVIALIGTSLGWIPPNLQHALAGMPFLPQPVLMFNMVCTNVPGPMVPLYSNRRELLTYYPHVPCGSEVGIGVAISSYHRGLYFGITYDGQAAPDGELFRDLLVETYEELRAAAGVPAVIVPTPPRREPEVASRPGPQAGVVPEEPPAPSPEPVVAEQQEPAETVLAAEPAVAVKEQEPAVTPEPAIAPAAATDAVADAAEPEAAIGPEPEPAAIPQAAPMAADVETAEPEAAVGPEPEAAAIAPAAATDAVADAAEPEAAVGPEPEPAAIPQAAPMAADVETAEPEAAVGPEPEAAAIVAEAEPAAVGLEEESTQAVEPEPAVAGADAAGGNAPVRQQPPRQPRGRSQRGRRAREAKAGSGQR